MISNKKAKKQAVPPTGQALLITVDSTIEADILESKLEASGIPVVRNYRESGAYLTLILGKTSFGVDMFVPAEKLDEAQSIVASAEEIRDEDILNDPSFKDAELKAKNEEFLKKMDRRTFWMAVFFFAAIAVLIYFIVSGL